MANVVANPAAKAAARAAGEAVERAAAGEVELGVLSLSLIGFVFVVSGVLKPPMYPIVRGRTERVQGDKLVTRPAPRTMRKLRGLRPVSCAATRSSA